MDTNRIMRPVLRQNEDWLDRCRLPPTWEARKTHTPTSIRTHTAQNTADLENDKCARRRRRENLRWASRHTRVWPFLGAAPAARRGL